MFDNCQEKASDKLTFVQAESWMNRRRFLQTGTASLGGVLTGVPELFAGSAPVEWNILVITSDEHNPKIMGCAGHPVIYTPAMDRLAREGTMFTRAYCADPICAPTRQSIMTGNYPQEHGQFTNSHVFNQNVRTWAHHFKAHGYATACIGKTHTNGDDKRIGFDYRNVAREGGAQAVWDPDDKKAYDASPDPRFSGRILEAPAGHHDGIVASDSIRWLRENRHRKFFLHASFVKPHWPWDAPRRFYHMYHPSKIDFPRFIPGDLDDDWAPRQTYNQWSWNKITESMHRIYRARYYGSLSWLDDNIGALLRTLDELGLASKTLVVYTSDHGDMAGEKGMWLKSNMFDASARVPLLIRMPGVVRAGRKCEELINHVDLFPTLAALAGCSAGLPANLTGKDVSAAVRGNGKGRDISFSVHGVRAWNQPPQQIMARTRRWKFVWYPYAPEETQRFVLYDMERDPDEVTNVAGRKEYAGVVREHQQAVRDFLASLKKPEYEPQALDRARKFTPSGTDDDARPRRQRKQDRRGKPI